MMPQEPQAGDQVFDRGNNGGIAFFTGRRFPMGDHEMLELRYPDGSVKNRPRGSIEFPIETLTIRERIEKNRYGKIRDFQRLITFEKLKGTLHEIIYSMEAAQIAFRPYQFKPVLKFINSPSQRLILADEVGLGKTIESGLVWLELQARRQARRLLVICPRILTKKWHDELKSKFSLDARIVDFRGLKDEVSELKKVGEYHSFVLIASYSGLRPPKDELGLLNRSIEEDDRKGTPKTLFLREVRHWNHDFAPFDFVIFDEAHYMRNPGTSTFRLGESLSLNEGTAVLCVSATPVNNDNKDLHTLLRLIDPDFFETQEMFDQLLQANRPTVKAINTLDRTPFEASAAKALDEAIENMYNNPYINRSSLFEQFKEQCETLKGNQKNQPKQITQAQDTAEKLNLLGKYINRTRRRQVEENRTIRQVRCLEIKYGPTEKALYESILKWVRQKCAANGDPFHAFRALGLQLMAASCLPEIAKKIRDDERNALLENDELLDESLGELVYSDPVRTDERNELFEKFNFGELTNYDFEKNDSKFDRLKEWLSETVNQGKKVVIFAYYRGTLDYLYRRLVKCDYKVAIIHGGIKHEERYEEIERFKNKTDVRILLSSEVGSEGLDLQFCNHLVNYDMPWNPMRVEQRIGRIDRVGQKSEQLFIFNFKVSDTIEERLYERLHEKLFGFQNSLGDLEDVIGKEIRQLTLNLLSEKLTPEQEKERIHQTEKAIENNLKQNRYLEDSGDTLVSLSDYIQKKIKKDHENGRFFQASELEDYLKDFFERNFQGAELSQNTPANGCMRIRLSHEARESLNDFLQNDHSSIAQPLRRDPFAISFCSEAVSKLSNLERKKVTFINHLSPLVRWVTAENQRHSFNFDKVFALEIETDEYPTGFYLYRIERWFFKGIKKRHTLNYGLMNLTQGKMLEEEESERMIQFAMRKGRNWDYASYDSNNLLRGYDSIKNTQQKRMDFSFRQFKTENETDIAIRVQRATNHWNRLINQSERSIQTMLEKKRKEKSINARRGRLKNENERKEQRMQELENGKKTNVWSEEIAAGIIHIKGLD